MQLHEKAYTRVGKSLKQQNMSALFKPKKNMKRIILMSLFALVVVFISNSASAGPKAYIGGLITIDWPDLRFHRPRHNCNAGSWMCNKEKHPDVPIDFFIVNNDSPEGDFQLTLLSENTLKITFLKSFDEMGWPLDTEFLEAEEGEDIIFTSAIANAFGCENITIKPKKYNILNNSAIVEFTYN